jgi:hypothetical protein
MGEYFDVVMAYGVAEPLAEAEQRNDHAQVVSELRQQVREVSTLLEKNLLVAPPETQKSLQKALEAAKLGPERNPSANKGKGPPWLRPESKETKGKGFPPAEGKETKGKGFPPGWNKKN